MFAVFCTLIACSRLPPASVPRGAAIEVRSSGLTLTINRETGAITIVDRRTGRTWRQTTSGPGRPPAPLRDIQLADDSISFTADFPTWGSGPAPLRLTLKLLGADRLQIDAQPPTDIPADGVEFLRPFVSDLPDAELAMVDYSNGHLYPARMRPFPREWSEADRLDIPAVGLCGSNGGPGYAMIIDTSDDAVLRCLADTTSLGPAAPSVVWRGSLGRFAYTRRLTYRFFPAGGYLEFARTLRHWARERGFLVTLAQKAQARASVRRLFGAVDVWGDSTPGFAREARAAGIDRMLIHGPGTPRDLREINRLGYLTSDYDNYTDMLPAPSGSKPDSSHGSIPADAVMQANGQRMGAWVTFDGQTRYMKRCPALWAQTARSVITDLVRTLPYLGRFIDVTTAEALYECRDPRHPLSRRQKREAGESLLRTVSSLGLVVGGEHGIWWGVPFQAYIEGMMSSYQFSWPAGHLIRPTSKDQRFRDPAGAELGPWSDYERWGIGYRFRAPLWELVFHDCVVSTWYWGDSSDFLLKAAPEVTRRKDAFNLLYGTMPLLWASGEGSWRTDRGAFMRTALLGSAVHRATATSAMVSHRFLTTDRAVQETRFANGTVSTVNFGDHPYEIRTPRGSYKLPRNGCLATGPDLFVAVAQSPAGEFAEVQRAGFYFRSSHGAAVVAEARSPAGLRVVVSGSGPVSVPPALAARGSRGGILVVCSLDGVGRRIGVQSVQATVGSRLILRGRPDGRPQAFDVVHRVSSVPELRVRCVDLLKQTQGPHGLASLGVTLEALGGSKATGTRLRVYADAARSERLLAESRFCMPSKGSQRIRVEVPTARLAGGHRLIIRADTNARELCAIDNQAVLPIAVAPVRGAWRGFWPIHVAQGASIVITRIPGAVPARVRDRLRVITGGAGRERFAVSQAENGPDGYPDRMVFRADPDGASVYRLVLPVRTSGRGTTLVPVSSGWDAAKSEFLGDTYSAVLADGRLSRIAPAGSESAQPAILDLITSSAETGWVAEPGRVVASNVMADGPVRTLIRLVKELGAGVRCERTFAFYGDRIELDWTVRPVVGIPIRAYYARKGEFIDSSGRTALIDGVGDAEGVSNATQTPRWYGVRGENWTEVTVARRTVPGIAYWDAANWGGIGFGAPSDGRAVVTMLVTNQRLTREAVREVAEGLCRESALAP